MVSNPDNLIADFARVTALAGLSISEEDITHEVLHAPHAQPMLPNGFQAVYVFSMPTPSSIVLKVGKAGPNSNARFRSQHYNPNSAGSNLAKSLLNRRDLWEQLGIQSLNEENVGEWIRNRTDRDHFFLDAEQETLVFALLEVFLQCRLRPIFEG